MKHALIFEATPGRPSGGVLLQLAVMLRQLNIDPEGLIWTAVPPDGLKIRLVLGEDDKHWLRDIADHLRLNSGVRDVRCEVVDEQLPPTAAPLSYEDQPFMD